MALKLQFKAQEAEDPTIAHIHSKASCRAALKARNEDTCDWLEPQGGEKPANPPFGQLHLKRIHGIGAHDQ